MWLLVFLPFAMASESKITPIEQVLNMLTDLQAKVVISGKEEAKTYDKYACFCKDATEEKTKAIETGQSDVDSLVSKMNAKNSDRNSIDDKMEELNKEIGSLTKEMEDETAKHHKNKAEFKSETDWMKAAIYGIDNAIKDIKGGANRPEKTGSYEHASFLSLKKHIKTIRHSLMVADALGLGNPEAHREVAALLQRSSQPSNGNSGAIAVNYEENEELGAALTTLQNLLNDFNSQLQQANSAEQKRVFSYDSFMQQRTDAKNLANKNMNKAKAMHQGKTQDISKLNGELTETQATLHDDQAYLKDLIEKCNAKSDEWDQRTKMRQAELAAISTAVNIIKERVDTGKKLKRFLQISTKVDEPTKASAKATAKVTDNDEDSDDEIDEVTEQEGDAMFLQLGAPRASLSLLAQSVRVEAKGDYKSEILALLKSKGAQFHSTMLLRMADKVAATVGADPFGKIKTLIEELIGRLNQEAADEATHKGWCDSSIGKASSTRDDKAEAIAMLNAQLDNHQTLKAKLEDEIATLASQISDLEDVKAKFTKAREDEKAENENTIKEAEDGLDGISDAIKVLEDFYGEAAKGGEAPSLIQKDDPTDSGDNDLKGDYKGDQSAATGILGMMDVIKSDMERTITETTNEEDKAKRDFNDLSRTTEISLETKGSAKTDKEALLGETKDKIRNEIEDMEGNQDLLDKALQELMELQPACIDTAMSYEERVAKREQEIESLKQALCILDKNGPVPDDSISC